MTFKLRSNNGKNTPCNSGNVFSVGDTDNRNSAKPRLYGGGSCLLCLFCFLLNGKAAARTLFVMLPMALLAAVINLLFSNRGITVLAKLPSGNSITLETLIFHCLQAL